MKEIFLQIQTQETKNFINHSTAFLRLSFEIVSRLNIMPRCVLKLALCLQEGEVDRKV